MMCTGSLSNVSANDTEMKACSLSNDRSTVDCSSFGGGGGGGGFKASTSYVIPCKYVSFSTTSLRLRLLVAPLFHQVVTRRPDFFVSTLSSLVRLRSRYSPWAVLRSLREHHRRPLLRTRITDHTAIPMTTLELENRSACLVKTVHHVPLHQALPAVATLCVVDVNTTPSALPLQPPTRLVAEFYLGIKGTLLQSWRFPDCLV